MRRRILDAGAYAPLAEQVSARVVDLARGRDVDALPRRGRGLARDTRVRWALEEAGLGYDDDLIGFEDQSTAAYRARQPFGQVPAFSDGKVEFGAGWFGYAGGYYGSASAFVPQQ